MIEHVERRPDPDSGWRELGRTLTEGGAVSHWRKGRILVISELAEIETNGIVGPTWLVSVSRRGGRQRVFDREMLKVIRDFKIPKPYDEDNHEPGIARKLFIPVNPEHRTACECKTDETIVVEPDGYRWSKPKAD